MHLKSWSRLMFLAKSPPGAGVASIIDGHAVQDFTFTGFHKEFSVIGLDQFDAIHDHLEAAAVLSIIGFPLGLIQVAYNGDTGTGMEIFFSDLGILVKAHAFEPAGFSAA